MSSPEQKRPVSKSVPVVPTWFLTIVTVPILVGMLWFGRDFLIPLALAILLFILNMALIERLDTATIAGRSVPRAVAYIAATALVFGLIVAIGYSIANQAAAMSEATPRYAERLSELKAQLEGFLGTERVEAVKRSLEEVDIKGFLTDFAASAAGIIGNVVLVLLYLAFMLAERGAFTEKLPRLCKTEAQASQVEKILKSISIGVQQYMWINAVTSAMSATLSFVVLSALGVDFAITLALAVFLLNFIPSIGFILAVMVQTAMALLQFDTITPALIIFVVYGGGDAIIGNIVQPRMQGKSLNLSTFVVMMALTFWGLIWGGIGAFVAVPLTVVIMIICSHIPGLQPYARLLSSDGVLPGEQAAPTKPAPAHEPSISGSDSAFGSDSAPKSEIEAEVAAMKQELLEEREARRRTSDEADADTAGTRPETRGS